MAVPRAPFTKMGPSPTGTPGSAVGRGHAVSWENQSQREVNVKSTSPRQHGGRGLPSVPAGHSPAPRKPRHLTQVLTQTHTRHACTHAHIPVNTRHATASHLLTHSWPGPRAWLVTEGPGWGAPRGGGSDTHRDTESPGPSLTPQPVPVGRGPGILASTSRLPSSGGVAGSGPARGAGRLWAPGPGSPLGAGQCPGPGSTPPGTTTRGRCWHTVSAAWSAAPAPARREPLIPAPRLPAPPRGRRASFLPSDAQRQLPPSVWAPVKPRGRRPRRLDCSARAGKGRSLGESPRGLATGTRPGSGRRPPT